MPKKLATVLRPVRPFCNRCTDNSRKINALNSFYSEKIDVLTNTITRERYFYVIF